MLEVEGYVDCVVYRPVDFVVKLQGVQVWVCDCFEVGQNKALKGLHYNGGQGDGTVVSKSCGLLWASLTN